MENGTTSPCYKNHKLVFIGGGNMASALIRGCVFENFVPKENIFISVKSEKSAEKWKSRGYENAFTNTEKMILDNPTAVFIICVKPQIFDEVVPLWPVNSRPKMIISVMAGIPLSILNEKLPFLSQNTTIIRLMPNVASSIGAGATSMCYETKDIPDQQSHIDFAKNFAKCVGSVEIVPERCLNAAMTIGASSPTFMYIEALADGAVSLGLGRSEAKRMAAQAVMGAAKMVLTPESGFNIETQHVGLLKDQVCSPGGTTMQGVRTLEAKGFRSAVIEAVVACAQKAEDMAAKFSK